MRSIGSILGIPAPPRGVSEWGEPNALQNIPDIMHTGKQVVANRVLQEVMDQAKEEVWEEIMRRIERDGVGVLKEMMDKPWLKLGDRTANEDTNATAVEGEQTAEAVVADNVEAPEGQDAVVPDLGIDANPVPQGAIANLTLQAEALGLEGLMDDEFGQDLVAGLMADLMAGGDGGAGDVIAIQV